MMWHMRSDYGRCTGTGTGTVLDGTYQYSYRIKVRVLTAFRGASISRKQISGNQMPILRYFEGDIVEAIHG